MKNAKLGALALLLVGMVALLTNCGKDNEALPYKYEAGLLRLPAQPYNYSSPQLPQHMGHLTGMVQSKVTDHGATLGRVLFYDPKLSLNNKVACASCHLQEKAFADGQRFSTGFDGGLTKRNASAIVNPIELRSFFWDAREKDLKEMVLKPIENHIEMGMDNFDALEKKLGQLDYYKALFNNAFGSEQVTRERIAEAMSQFLNSMVSGGSTFDRSIPGTWGVSDPTVFTARQQEGLSVFLNNCVVCHSTATPSLFGGEEFANIGLDSNPVDKGLGANEPGMDGVFKIPSLRNVALTGPYMHDGRFNTLREVVDHYSDNIKPADNLHWALTDGSLGQPRRMNLSDSQKDALVDFLSTMTDQRFLSDDKFSDPFKQ
jgi:cytochrome c peroxidase